MTDTQDAHKNDLPTRSRAAAWRRRWWIGLLAVCLLASGVYVFVIRAGEGPSRAADVPPELQAELAQWEKASDEAWAMIDRWESEEP